MDDFIIDEVSWHLNTPDNPEGPTHIRDRFRAIVMFLQANGLCTRDLLSPDQTIADNFAIHSGDLTETGLAVMKSAYDRWLRKIDKGMSPKDVSLLEKSLAKHR